MTSPQMTDKQIAILEDGAHGTCEKYVWRWTHDGTNVTAVVNKLIKLGLAEAQYYSDGAYITATEAGRAAMAELNVAQD